MCFQELTEILKILDEPSKRWRPDLHQTWVLVPINTQLVNHVAFWGRFFLIRGTLYPTPFSLPPYKEVSPLWAGKAEVSLESRRVPRSPAPAEHGSQNLLNANGVLTTAVVQGQGISVCKNQVFLISQLPRQPFFVNTPREGVAALTVVCL